MKRLSSYHFLLLFLAGWYACERPIDIALGNEEPELVVLANFSDLDTIEVVLTKSQSVFDNSPATYISDAEVTLFADGFFADELFYVSSPIPQIPGYYLSNKIVPQAGSQYKLTVNAPGFDPVEGTCTMPLPVDIDTGYTSLLLLQEDLGDGLIQATIHIEIKILDAPEVQNYYHLNFYQKGYDYFLDEDGDTIRTSFFSLPLALTADDGSVPLVPYIEDRGVLFSDEALKDNNGVLSFTTTFQYYEDVQFLGDFLIELRTASREYFLFHRSLARQFQASQDPFSEPVILYSNIENGQGVFAGFLSRFYVVDAAQ